MFKKFYLFVLTFFIISNLFAQQNRAVNIATAYLKAQAENWQLKAEDINDISISNKVYSAHNGLTHIYLQQQYKGIKIHNAISVVNVLSNGEVLYASNGFLSDITKKALATSVKIQPEYAITVAAAHLEIEQAPNFDTKVSKGRNTFSFDNTGISNTAIQVEPVYQLMPDGKLHLAWQFAIDMIDKVDYWNVRVDALTGEVIGKNNWTTKCSFGMHRHTNNCGFLERQANECAPASLTSMPSSSVDGSSYNVFAFPIESPIHGDRSLVNEPADPIASPFGWHDTDGIEGPEFTITRGNNVHAYADLDDINLSSGDEPDGGADLVFDFPFDPNAEPIDNQDAAVTQLFYYNNIMHDFAYAYGFDEQAGNFQATNFTITGRDNDFVEAEALDDLNGGSADNASFGTPPDGLNASMSMFVWSRAGSQILQVSSPPAVAGSYEAREASFGPRLDSIGVSGEVVVVEDGSNAPTLGCFEFENVEEVAGNIAIIDRGNCNFVDKIRNAQAAGAIAAIVCNFEPTLITMGAPPNDNTSDILIPSVFMRSGECAIIRQFAGEGLSIDLRIPRTELEGPDQLDGSFDNGIMAHEYAHGISNRLTGGAANTDCLFNREQMGEGWSDFFSLITSVQSDDTGADKRGVGTYVLRQETDGVGIRRFPYSTDMSVNPLTYKNILGAAIPHGVGEVWAVMLWDLYWAMVEEYGFESDLYRGTGGNNRAIQLVMDGMKIQACNPGFISGRDAILAADRSTFGGANQCLIWEVFARRGLGFSADQGDTDDRNDVIEGFDVPPTCTNELSIDKSMTPNINPGEDISITLTIANFTGETATNLVITDVLPEGTTLASTNLPNNGQLLGNTLQFEIPQLANEATATIAYNLSSSPELVSLRQFLDDGENGDVFWLPVNLDDESTNIWDLQDVIASSGDFAWHVVNPSTDSEQALQLDEEITVSGTKPVLRFNQWHDLDPGTDAGIVEVSTDFGITWEDVDTKFIRNGYSGPISYFTFASPDRRGFWGNSGDFITSYVDLSSYLGETIIIRFRFGSVEDEGGESGDFDGWFIDDVEFLDLTSYQAEACVTSGQGDNACALATGGGTFVEIGELNTSVADLENLGLDFAVFPNPAGDFFNVRLSNKTEKEGIISLFNMNGQQLIQKDILLQPTPQVLPFNVKDIASGFYFIEVKTLEGVAMKKIILE